MSGAKASAPAAGSERLTLVKERPTGDDFSEMPPIMTPQMFADQLPDVEVRTLQDWRYRKIGPAYTRDEDTRRVYYLRSDVIAWLTSSRHNTH